jgi:hypothetical protein
MTPQEKISPDKIEDKKDVLRRGNIFSYIHFCFLYIVYILFFII